MPKGTTSKETVETRSCCKKNVINKYPNFWIDPRTSIYSVYSVHGATLKTVCQLKGNVHLCYLIFSGVLRLVRKIAINDCCIGFVKRQSAWNSSAPTGRILMKFDI
jgi:hypothetical protein